MSIQFFITIFASCFEYVCAGEVEKVNEYDWQKKLVHIKRKNTASEGGGRVTTYLNN